MPGHHHDGNNHEADIYTNIGAVGESITGFISNAFWLGNFFDAVTGFSAEIGGLSYYGLAVGLAASTFTTAGATYCHRVLNTVHQSPEHHEPDLEKSIIQDKTVNEGSPLLEKKKITNLTVKQKVALVGDYASHVGTYAAPLTFVVGLATQKDNIPQYGKILTQCGATLFGAVSSFSDVRTCYQSLVKSNFLHSDEKTQEDSTIFTSSTKSN